jgi:Cu/Ag efflux protein CusF
MRSLFRLLIPLAIVLVIGVSPMSAQNAGKKEYVFKGKDEKVDAKANVLTVNNENIPGWMVSMSMSYAVDKGDVLKTLKVGDVITARVYDGDFKTLYNVKVVPPKPADQK